MRASTVLIAIAVAATAWPAAAQQPGLKPPQQAGRPPAAAQPAPAPATPAPAAPAPSTPAPAAPVAPGEPQSNYTYEREGRRDPFLSLVGGGVEHVAGSRKGEGPSGMMVADISVRGIVESRGELVAMVHGPDNKTYLVHQGDKLADGVIKTITPQGLVIVQDVNDPLSLVKQREVRKLLRSLEDGK